jgi:hypothetical protein
VCELLHALSARHAHDRAAPQVKESFGFLATQLGQPVRTGLPPARVGTLARAHVLRTLRSAATTSLLH